MLMTVNLSEQESKVLTIMREPYRNWARAQAKFHGKRFVQVVDFEGRIIDILEVEL